MTFSIEQYQKSSLTLIATILLSVSSVSQAGYFNKESYISLCMKKGMGVDEQTFLSTPEFLVYWDDYDAYINDVNSDSVRDDLRRQTYAAARSVLYGSNLQPTLLKTQALIMHANAEPISMYTPYQYDEHEVLSDPGSFYTDSSVAVHSFGINPSPWQFLGGATTMTSPGIQYNQVSTTRLMDIPPYQGRFKRSCDSTYNSSMNKLN